MRGIKTKSGLPILAAGHAFVQNLRRGHYEIATDEPCGRHLAVAFAELTRAIRPKALTVSAARHASPSNNATEPVDASIGAVGSTIEMMRHESVLSGSIAI